MYLDQWHPIYYTRAYQLGHIIMIPCGCPSTRQRRDVIFSVTALASSSSPTSDVVIISLLGDNLINFHPFCQIYGHCKDDDGDVINPFLGWLVVVVHILHPSPSCCCAIKRSSTHSHRTTTHTFHIMLYSSGGGLRMGE